MTLNRFIVPFIAITIGLGACEPGEDRSVEGSQPDDSVEVIAPTPGALTPINQSGVRGTAEASRDGDGLEVSVEAEGMDAGGSYTVILHQGRCAESGPVLLPLGRVVADGNGEGSLRTEVEPGRAPSGAELFVQLHAADDRTVACANIGPGE